MLYKKIYILLILFAAFSLIKAEELPSQSFSNFEGRHFYVGFMENEVAYMEPHIGVVMQLFISTRETAKIEIIVDDTLKYEYTLQPENVLPFNNIPLWKEHRDSETVSDNKLVEIKSDVPITVYAFSSQKQTSDSWSVIPVSNYGKEYIALTMPNDQYDPGIRDSSWSLMPRQSEFLIMAAYDSTEIKFSPRAYTEENKQPGVEYTIQLNKGESYLVKSQRNVTGTNDLSGTIVRGNKPFGFMSGHVRSAVPQGQRFPNDSKDHLAEMLTPTSTWGRQFFTAPLIVNYLGTPLGDFFRIVSKEANTILNWENETGQGTITFNYAGEVKTVPRLSWATYWHSSKPVQIAQYMSHIPEDPDEHGYYDPFMAIVPPAEQFVQRISFSTPGSVYVQNQFISHDVILILEEAAVGNIKLDGKYLADFYPIIYPDYQTRGRYYYSHLTLEPGSHEIIADSGKFSGLSYGYGAADSYGTILGSALNSFTDSIPPLLDISETCGRINGIIRERPEKEGAYLHYVKIIKDSTFNYLADIDTVGNTSSRIEFYAEPEDPMKDAMIVIEYMDKSGNRGRYRFKHEGIYIDSPDEILFGNVIYTSQKEITAQIINTDSTETVLANYEIKGDNRLLDDSEIETPKIMQPGDTLEFILKFIPDKMTDSLIAELILEFDCDRDLAIPIKGNVITPQIVGYGHDFGYVPVGDTVCGHVTYENKGGLPVIIDSIAVKKDLTVFTYELDNYIPVTLLPGESIKIPVCFIPEDSIIYSEIFVAYNNFNIYNDLTIRGRGIAPSIDDVMVDFGKKRVGTDNFLTAVFRNKGLYKGSLEFNGFETQNELLSMQNDFTAIEAVVDSMSAHPVEIKFNPESRQQYELTAEYLIDSPIHGPVRLTVAGEGTMPDIETNSHVFAETLIYDSTEEVLTFAMTGGNEDISIDDIFIIEGDEESFQFDPGFYEAKQFPPGTAIDVRVVFNPQKTGVNRIKIGILNDSYPAYEYKTDTLVIEGTGLPRDTIDPRVSISAPDIILACNNEKAEITVSNQGNVDIDITDIALSGTPSGFKTEFSSAPGFPKKLLQGEDTTYIIDVIASDDGYTTLQAVISINDTITKNISHEFKVIKNPVHINDLSGLEFEIGDTASITLSGTIPNSTDTEFNLEFILDYNDFAYVPKWKNAVVIITSPSSSKSYPLDYTINGGKINFKAKGIKAEADSSEWEIELQFKVMLHNSTEHDFSLSIIPDFCFNNNMLDFSVKIKDICIFNLRPIKLITNLPSVKIYPNPVNENLQVRITLPEGEKASVFLIDKTGKEYKLNRDRRLARGVTTLNYDIASFPSGVYILSLRTKSTIMNKMFIITK
ncbi:MAG: T9SS type A sorting domain-containing protein [Candidatus Kapaibacterium sp.]